MRYFLICFLLVALRAATQQPAEEVLNELAGKLIQQYNSEAKTLLSLSTDKKIYRAGTQLWFRTFMYSSNGFPVAAEDKVIYVELADVKDNVIDRVLLNKEEMQFHGSLTIPSNATEGYYQLRAYTKSILENLPADIFTCPLYITNVAGKDVMKSLQRSAVTAEPVINFYPEGGNLVNGVDCSVVFTAADKYGKPVQISGTVKDNKGSEVTSFTGSGIGKFVFQPYSKDRTYKIFVKANNTTELVYDLPAIRADAFQLALQQRTAEELLFRVVPGDSVYNKKAASYLLAVAAGKICFAAAGSGMYMVNVPVSELPHGLVDFYLFDREKKIVSRRTVFNEASSTVINITTDRQDYLPRQKAKVNIGIMDSEGKPVKAALSVTITDKKLTGETLPLHPADEFILQRFSGGLPIHDLSSNAEKRDLLAITIGNEAGRQKNTPLIKIGKNFYWDGLEIKGHITDKQNAALANELVALIPEGDNNSLFDSTDKSGAFSFRNLEFYGRKLFHVMLPSVFSKQQKYEISTEEISYPEIHTGAWVKTDDDLVMETATVFKKLQADSCVSNEARAGLQQLALQEAGEKKKSNVSKRGLDPHRITGEQLDKLSLSNTVDAVKMLPGVVMMSNRLTLRGGIQSIAGNLSDVEPLLIVDGVNTRAGSVVDYLNSIPPSNIDYIEVLTGPEAALYGSRGGNGAIVVKTSNKLRDSKLYEGKEKQTITATGFYKEQPFFEPGYDNYSVREAVFTDNRATIYWNGQLITDDAGKAAFSFYTADLKHDYTLTVQGITDKGEVIFKTVTIKRR
jgi:hypothetical protein